jgi:hypothetical protein
MVRKSPALLGYAMEAGRLRKPCRRPDGLAVAL